jgi:YndJ-like protein
MVSTSQFARTSAAVGGLLWIVTLLIRTGDSRETDLIQKIFLLAVFVIVPLALSLISPKEDWIAIRIAAWAQPISATLCFVSFLVPQGVVAGILASLWLALTALIAFAGLLRLALSTPRLTNEQSISAGMLYLPIGGAWLVASRLGIQPLGFGDTIVLLTAVHFHFAGFAAPVLAGLVGRVVTNRTSASRTVTVAALAIVIGTPIVAAGITLSPTVALVGAFIVTLGLTLLAVVVIGSVNTLIKSRLARVFLLIGSLSSCAAMVLACLYAYSIVSHTLIIDIPKMAMTHGLLNSLGFALCSLLAWSFEKNGS